MLGRSPHARWRGFKTLLILAITLTFVSVMPGLAQAARNHVFSQAIGSKGSKAGQLELAAPIEEEAGTHSNDITGGSGVAVNDLTHDIYVADTGNHRIDEFSATGAFILSFGKDVNKTAVAESRTSEENVCPATGHSADVCQAGSSGAEPGGLEAPLFIAVDNSPGGEGAVYVGDTGDDRVSKFRGDGSLIPGDDGVLDDEWGNGGPLGEANGQLAGPTAAEPFAVLYGLAVDTNGHLWIDAKHPAQIEEMFEFEQAGTFTGTSWHAEAEPSGVAVNKSEELYVDGHRDVEKYTAAGAPVGGIGSSLNGALFPEPSPNFTGLAADISSGLLYLDGESAVDVVSGSCPPPVEQCVVAESFGAPQLTGGAGLAVDPNGAVVYAANTSADTVDQFIEEPPSAPSVTSDSVSEVTATSAIFGGEVDPDSLGGEPDTKYHFEYGECTTGEAGGTESCRSSPYSSTTSVGALAPSFNTESVSPAPVQGLTAGRTYHYRLVAENEAKGTLNTVAGEEHTFTTQAAGTFVLPDNRQWEIVSPVQKFGALIEPIAQEGIIQAAADGDAFTYHANAPIEAEPQGAMNEVQILSTREADGWSSHDIEPSHSSPTDKPEGEGEPYRFFSENLQLALVQPAGAFEPGLTPESSETTPVLRTDYLNGNVSESCLPKSGMSCYRPLVTAKEGYANVPSGTQFGEARGERDGPCPYARPFCGPQLEGASANGEHVVFNSYASLTETPTPSGDGLYEWSADKPPAEQLQLVSILPKEEGGGAETGLSYLGTHLTYNTRGAISENGSRVVWKGEDGKLYLRDTNPLSSRDPDAQTTTAIGSGEFQAANRDVSKVFFTTTSIGGSLFEYDVETGKTATIAEEAAGVQGLVIGASEDGSYLYFVADGQLGSTGAEGAVKGTCTVEPAPTPGERCNLYVYHDGTTKLVAVLSGEDGPDWAKGSQELTNLTARVSPNGRYLSFVSDRDLTGYDPTDATTGKPDEEVYEYDAETGHLACASCEPTGGRSHGIEYGIEGKNMPRVGGDGVWEQYVSLAANIPGWTPYKNEHAAYQSRYLSDSGRLFFNSDDGLVPKDANNNWDVYEYEPQGVPTGEHACGAGSASGSDVFKPGAIAQVEGRTVAEGAGCVALISGGQSNEESAFLDASAGGGEGEDGEPGSEAGRDVFFLTTAKLAPQDSDTAFDVYDARECTSASPCIPPPASTPPACNTEASCKAPPTPQPGIYGPPPSATFEGIGDLTPAAREAPSGSILKPLTRAQKLTAALKVCRKDRSKSRRKACEATARKRFGVVKGGKKRKGKK